MKIVFYAPDRHILYGGSTPDTVGVGGGITARLRMAAALARIGHDVTVIGNVPDAAVHEQVRFLPLTDRPVGKVDVLIVHSSGGALDVGSASELPLETGVRILLVSGVTCPNHAEAQRFDAVYSPSNFINRVVSHNWPLRGLARLVTDCGAIRASFLSRWLTRRNPKRLIYTSHPSKGLDAAIRLLRLLRTSDPEFELHIFGGNALWGMPEVEVRPEPGLIDHGLIGQKQLANEYLKARFAIHLQTRHEPFGISLAEAMSAGCIVIASPTGSFPGLITNGVTGYLVPGDPSDEDVLSSARDCILNAGPRAADITRAAQRVPFSWTALARVWEAHFRFLISGNPHPLRQQMCSECNASAIMLADGAHCLSCGHYDRGPGGF